MSNDSKLFFHVLAYLMTYFTVFELMFVNLIFLSPAKFDFKTFKIILGSFSRKKVCLTTFFLKAT